MLRPNPWLNGASYIPHELDFRGRLYGIPHFNFAREDQIRGLFLFADGEPIGDEGLLWLKAHVAKCAGSNSNLNFEQRVAWTDQNIDRIYDVAERALRCEPIPDLPDDPIQYIAACIELKQALDQGPDFITRLPVTFDGSCSGLQHLCAMTGAEEGRYVNLLNGNAGRDDI